MKRCEKSVDQAKRTVIIQILFIITEHLYKWNLFNRFN